ncbi:hypothetical protein AQUCO_01700204v1 [Aquilegia coerulea]|uniref:NAC domain-containing protein n=1 Tax=Aquilegia coerulea TaxID=218851 RepID=A0A2G5DLQ9_AQUCA|nr:hypothetical protein AQUCO_01700204v1 [Aquilegia coerulea]
MEEEYMMMMESNGEEEAILVLPPGFRFCPTKQELLKYYLYNKVVGEDLPALNVILEKTLYGDKAEEPSQIFAGSSEEFLYIFTLVNKKFDNVNGKKMDRETGKGRWEMQNNHPVYDDPPYQTTVIGYDKTFNYIKNADKKSNKMNSKVRHGKRESKKIKEDEEKISWIMHEYTFEYAPSHKQQAEWTICKIRKKISSKNKDVSMPESKRARTSYALALPPKTAKPSDVRLLQKNHNQYLQSTLVVMPGQQKSDHPHPESQPCTHFRHDSDKSETDSISWAMAYTPFAGAMSIISDVPPEHSQPIQSYNPSPHDHIDALPVHQDDAIFSLDDLVQLPSLGEDDVYSLKKVQSFTDMVLADDDMNLPTLD